MWQQLNWQIVDTAPLTLSSRTRLEERINPDQPGTAERFRQRLWLRKPFKPGSNYLFSINDEIFLNLNHPHWVSPYTFEQNRAFIGMAEKVSATIMIDVGYLNQYLHNVKNFDDHVFLISLTVKNK